MQPATQNLPITPGSTYRDMVRLMQPVYEYRAITAIAGAPAQLSVPAHDLAGDWPVWVRDVSGLPAINRDLLQAPWIASRIDDDTLEINAISAAGMRPSGGQLVYRPPVDLAGASAVMQFIAGGVVVLELVPGAGLTIESAGTIRRELTAQQTADLGEAWTYTFSIRFSDNSVVEYLRGGPASGGSCGRGC